ncbi:lysostaphin resistance A-like protein [Chloroflexota bacterium]
MTDQNTSLSSEIENPQIKRQLWGPWSTLGFGLVVGIVSLITQGLVVVPFVISKTISDSTLNPLQLVEMLISDGLFISLAIVTSSIVGIGLILVIIKVRRRATIAEYLGLRRITKKVILILLAITTGIIISEYILALIIGETQNAAWMVNAYNTSIWPALFWIAVVICAPLFEEAFFRGFMFVGFQQSRIGVVGTIGLTALIWALMHVQYDVYTIAGIFVLGILLGIIRFKTDSLWSPLLIHVLINLIATVELSLN